MWLHEPARAAVVLAAVGATILEVPGAHGGSRQTAVAMELAALLLEAERANAAHDLAAERRALARAERLRGDPDDVDEVQRRLAVHEWKYDRQFPAARQRLRTTAEQSGAMETWLALARLETAAEDWPAAIAAARRAFERGDDADERRQSRLALSATIADAALHTRLNGGSATQPGLLQEAYAHLIGLVAEEPGRLETSQRLLQVSLLLERWDAALVAWRSYYGVAPGGTPPNAVAAAGTRLQALLTGARDDTPDRAAIAQALADTRFFSEAALLIASPDLEPGSATANLRAVVAYVGLLARLRTLTDEYYRQTLLGRGAPPELRDAVAAEARRFLERIDLAGLDPSAEIEGLRRVGAARYGTLINLDTTAGFFDLHMGHIVTDDRRHIEQYGHAADVRFIVLDHMVSNGFQSWAWESGAQHGGWGGGTEIVQIRPAYLSDPLSSWAALVHDRGRGHVTAAMDEASAADELRATADPYAFLPGLNWRLMQQGVTGVFERVSASGLQGDALRLAFLSALRQALQESSIFAHEGRHVIDSLTRPEETSTERLEYWAKLSEVVFAPEPRLAFNGIISPNIGDSSAHGRANARLMREIVVWMAEHGSEIADLDPARPLLPQFDKLTDGQMRTLFRSLDPLAR